MTELQTEPVEALGTLVLVFDIMEVVGNTNSQGAVFIEDRNSEFNTCETFYVYSF